ncbi:MAG: O-antigen ligase family protein [Hyphomicrobiaceae bacterium]|nr:O-antigen ligase family protein [Hyphomicrobiaceae bacterium]
MSFLSLLTKDRPEPWAVGLFVLFLLAFFIGQPLFGSYGSAAALIVAMAALVLFISKDARTFALKQKTLWIFLLAYVLLVTPFLFTAEEPHDLIYAANFLAFILVVPTLVLTHRFRGNAWALVVVSLALLGAGLGLLISGFSVLIEGQNRAQGMMANPNMLAQLTLTFGFTALAGFHLTEKWWRFLFLAGPIMAGVVILLSGSRGVLVSAVPVGVFGLIFLSIQPGVRRWVYAGIAVAVLGVGGLLVVDRDALGPINRALSIQSVTTRAIEGKNLRDWSAFMRLELYKGAVRAFFESPIIGHGWQDAVQVAARDIPGKTSRYRKTNAQLAARWPNMHNDPLGFAAASGIFGIASYLLLMVAPITVVGRRDRFFAHRLFLMASLVASTLVHGLIDAPFGHDMGVNTYALLTVLVLGVFQPRDDDSQPAESQAADQIA